MPRQDEAGLAMRQAESSVLEEAGDPPVKSLQARAILRQAQLDAAAGSLRHVADGPQVEALLTLTESLEAAAGKLPDFDVSQDFIPRTHQPTLDEFVAVEAIRSCLIDLRALAATLHANLDKLGAAAPDGVTGRTAGLPHPSRARLRLTVA